MHKRNLLILASVLIVLSSIYYTTKKNDTPQPKKTRYFVWDVEMDELAKMEITLPRFGKKEAWVKHDDQYWYFDNSEGSKVNMQRWGGGIPLLLSGPEAERLITDNASEKQLDIFGLLKPSMRVDLTLENKKKLKIDVGDHTPDDQYFYVRLRQSNDIYTVHESWYHVMEKLVLEPPYPDPDEKPKSMDPKELEIRKKEALLRRENLEKGDKFRSKYKEATGVVELESGILYKVLKKGIGRFTKINNEIAVHFSGRFIDGRIFDSSKKGKPLEISLNRVIKGWRIVLQKMKEGSKWEVVIPPELGYGRFGSGENIGPNETLLFEIELIEIK